MGNRPGSAAVRATNEGKSRAETLHAMREALEGRTIKCESFEDYQEKAK